MLTSVLLITVAASNSASTLTIHTHVAVEWASNSMPTANPAAVCRAQNSTGES